MRRGLWVSIVVLAAMAAMLLAACGDDDEETTTGAAQTPTSAEPVTKDEYIEQADAACGEAMQEVNALAQETFSQGQPDPEQVQTFFSEAQPAIITAFDKIRAIPPPEGDEQDVESIHTAIDDAETGIDEIVAADPAEVEQLAREDPFTDFEKASRDYGLKTCAQG